MVFLTFRSVAYPAEVGRNHTTSPPDGAAYQRGRHPGDRKQGHAAQLLGSVPNMIAHEADCSVPVVKTA